MHGECNREVEGVVCSFVYYDEAVSTQARCKRNASKGRSLLPVYGERTKINFMLGSSKLINQLSHLSLIGNLVEEFE